ncbi:sulfatase [Mesoplasma chauliocola]|uniref:Sulfatase n=1 Tax=Mesoplasma chauliocola TaxID=216427 RepID=A0A249SP77_9MOLU|nr:sulfatase-like hydrolase/transferase [Mesoplasma chauliocola]ASZ09389.1 sulfatase [Mesoplasma chauliocola]
MKAIIIMFDTLAKDFMPMYGNEWVHAPNFKKLSKKMITFNNFYGGSMPCMPARREMHTGKYNFMHRGWGPLEYFDFSVFEELNKNGIYTHLVTDHSHYWEDGGGTYHNRYTTWDGFRGQEGDRWMPREFANIVDNNNVLNKKGDSVVQHFANRFQQIDESEFSTVKTINAGVEFIRKYNKKDNWLLQIECFDPHEPFYVPEKYRKIYESVQIDNLPYFPKYTAVKTDEERSQISQMRKEYAALISMVDNHLGDLIDELEKNNMFEDTLIILNTDHGFLLGEHDWIGKNIMPMYDEIIHTPFMINVPNVRNIEKVDTISQTIDIAPTLLDFFNINCKRDIDGKSLLKVIEKEVQKENEKSQNILFGINGGHICIYDGKYIYMRGSENEEKNKKLTVQTTTFTNMRGFFSIEELKTIKQIPGNKYSDYLPIFEVQKSNYLRSDLLGNLLFDMENDKKQMNPLKNPDIENEMIKKLIIEMEKYEAPQSEFERLGLK